MKIKNSNRRKVILTFEVFLLISFIFAIAFIINSSLTTAADTTITNSGTKSFGTGGTNSLLSVGALAVGLASKTPASSLTSPTPSTLVFASQSSGGAGVTPTEYFNVPSNILQSGVQTGIGQGLTGVTQTASGINAVASGTKNLVTLAGVNVPGVNLYQGALTYSYGTVPVNWIGSTGSFEFQNNIYSLAPDGGRWIWISKADTAGLQKFAANPNAAATWDPAHPITSIFGGKANLGITGAGGQVAGALVAGVAWAGTAYLAVTLIGSMIGLKKGTEQALQNAVLAGGFTAGALHALVANGYTAGQNAGAGLFHFLGVGGGIPAGLIVAVAVFIATYKESKTETVTFTCLPWEPPIGGINCQQCNKDPFRPCTEYRCKSLGQACELLNADVPGKAACTWVNPKDVIAPTIEPLTSALTPSTLKYSPDNTINPPDRGVKIVDKSTSDGCLKAFTPLTFGITTNTSEGSEPAKCKIDYSRSNQTGTAGFDAMQFYFGGDNYFAYNHTQIMSLPGPNDTGVDYGPILRNDGSMAMYVKCVDANGNVNEADFVFTFCVEKGPDTTPPIIEGTSINNNGYVSYNADHVPIEVYTNEPAKCRWSRTDQDFNGMENQMKCASDSSEINTQLTYTCSDNLTSIENSQDNNFFFRCQDYPDTLGAGNNSMQQSYELTLKGSQPLQITDLEPSNTTISGNTDQVPVTLNVTTSSGANEGNAICYYSPTGNNDSYIQMFTTNSYISSQTLNLAGSSEGTNYTYFVRCIDAGGNAADAETTFTVIVDKYAPIITRAYKEIPDALEIVTDKPADCVYSLTSCNYDITTGQKMLHPDANTTNVNLADWKSNAFYYIKCQDAFGNNPGNDCSLVVSAVELTGNSTS